MSAEGENHGSVMKSNLSSLVLIFFTDCLALILGLLGLFLLWPFAVCLAEDAQYIHSPHEALRYITGQYFRNNDGIDCASYDSYNPEIKNRKHWKEYVNSALEISFSYPPGADIK